MTRLESFLKANKPTPSAVAREAHVSRQHLLRVRKGMMSPTVKTALRLRDACGRLLSRTVRISELFGLE